MQNGNWFQKDVKEVEEELKTDLEQGLTNEEVVKRREKYGLNELKSKKKKSLFQKFLDQFKDFSIIVLIIAAIVSGFVGVAEGEGITDTNCFRICRSCRRRGYNRYNNNFNSSCSKCNNRSNTRIKSRKIIRGTSKINRPCIKGN